MLEYVVDIDAATEVEEVSATEVKEIECGIENKLAKFVTPEPLI